MSRRLPRLLLLLLLRSCCCYCIAATSVSLLLQLGGLSDPPTECGARLSVEGLRRLLQSLKQYLQQPEAAAEWLAVAGAVAVSSSPFPAPTGAPAAAPAPTAAAAPASRTTLCTHIWHLLHALLCALDLFLSLLLLLLLSSPLPVGRLQPFGPAGSSGESGCDDPGPSFVFWSLLLFN